ncbi:MAG: response regulator [Proteobacteria bacterium]|nr:response regulator [Desulfobulbaceae bacterium]MBU4151846.1 response regulator [Pseudomonadota bacterium]MDP2106791.1 response regulator [Desulfobulbaceae bacterium]
MGDTERGEQAYSILLVDDEEVFRKRLAAAFTRRGFLVHEAAEFEGAMEVLRSVAPDLALVDLRMPGRSGLELVAEAKALQPDIQIVVLTGYGSIATASQAIKLGAIQYLPKPADVDEILRAFAQDGDVEIAVSPEDLTPPSLARVEWEHIQRVLADCDGNISEAARKLHIHRRSLQRKLFKYAPSS